MKYIWQNNNWPDFRWDKGIIATLLQDINRRQSRLLGSMEALGFSLRSQASLKTITADVLRSSAIEGEHLDKDEVRSSIARKMGLDIAGLVPASRNVQGVVEMTLDATTRYSDKLVEDRLYAWHNSLFPSPAKGLRAIAVGQWRLDKDGPIQVISGQHGRIKVHYQAPPADRVSAEMQGFLEWFETPTDCDPFVFAGLAHFWFVTIHPFEDGNGRIARAITDLALARAAQSSERFYSMSTQIQRTRKNYYNILEQSQASGLDLTTWLQWFLSCLSDSIANAHDTLHSILQKARFWREFSQAQLSQRQIVLINRLLDGFEGKMTSSKWAKIAKCSQDTAHRDIVGLIKIGAMQKDEAGGRSTSYSLLLPQNLSVNAV